MHHWFLLIYSKFRFLNLSACHKFSSMIFLLLFQLLHSFIADLQEFLLILLIDLLLDVHPLVIISLIWSMYWVIFRTAKIRVLLFLLLSVLCRNKWSLRLSLRLRLRSWNVINWASLCLLRMHHCLCLLRMHHLNVLRRLLVNLVLNRRLSLGLRLVPSWSYNSWRWLCSNCSVSLLVLWRRWNSLKLLLSILW